MCIRDRRGPDRAHGQEHAARVRHRVRGRRPGVRARPPDRGREVPEDDGVEGMKVIVAGAGTLGRRVARYVGEKHDVTIVEQSRERCASVTEEFRSCGKISVLCGDIDEPAILLEAGVDRADVFVAATGHDEDNLVVPGGRDEDVGAVYPRFEEYRRLVDVAAQNADLAAAPELLRDGRAALAALLDDGDVVLLAHVA